MRSVIVHDHASGEWSLPRGPKRALKWLLARTPAIVADHVITVSNYVARRQTLVGHIPSARVEVVWNGLPIPPRRDEPERRTHAMFGLDIQRPLIMCACRAAPEKGVAFLLRAFERVVQQAPLTCPRPGLLYIGDGPQLLELRALADSLAARNDIILGGYRRDTKELLGGADLCVIPSLWQDAFPLAVLEAMALGKPVIATRVGGIPEMIEHGITGLLVAAGDEAELATAIRSILEDPNKARRLGEAARERVAQQFTPERQIRRLTEIVERGFRSPCEMVRQA